MGDSSKTLQSGYCLQLEDTTHDAPSVQGMRLHFELIDDDRMLAEAKRISEKIRVREPGQVKIAHRRPHDKACHELLR